MNHDEFIDTHRQLVQQAKRDMVDTGKRTEDWLSGYSEGVEHGLETLSARIAELEAQIDRVREVHEPIEALNMRSPGGRVTSVCTGCGTDNGNWQIYPCPTIRALDARRGGQR